MHGSTEIGAIRTRARVKLHAASNRGGWRWGEVFLPSPFVLAQSLPPSGERFRFSAGNIHTLRWQKGCSQAGPSAEMCLEFVMENGVPTI